MFYISILTNENFKHLQETPLLHIYYVILILKSPYCFPIYKNNIILHWYQSYHYTLKNLFTITTCLTNSSASLIQIIMSLQIWNRTQKCFKHYVVRHCLWTENLNSDGQQFHHYQQNFTNQPHSLNAKKFINEDMFVTFDGQQFHHYQQN